MATQAGTIETLLQQRLRIGTAQTAISDTNIYSVMNNVQRSLNHILERVVTTGTFKCASSNTTINGTTTTVAADCVYVVSLYESSRTLIPTPQWTNLVQYDLEWQTSAGERSETWTSIGSRTIAVYPASTVTYTCVYLQETTTLNSSGDLLNFPDEDAHLVTELCEIVWLTHLRLYPEADIKIKEFTQSIQAHIEHIRHAPKGHVY